MSADFEPLISNAQTGVMINPGFVTRPLIR
jgi:hypothetical protein